VPAARIVESAWRIGRRERRRSLDLIRRVSTIAATLRYWRRCFGACQRKEE
jgi:hypothetical protein